MDRASPFPGARLLSALNPLGVLGGLWLRRELVGQFTRKEISVRFTGSFLGVFWSLITPLVMLVVFIFVFGVVFKTRWPGTGGSLPEFALLVFVGQMAFQIFADPVGRSPGLIVASPNLVKKVIFPLDVIPIAAVGAGLFQSLAGLLVCAGIEAWIHKGGHWTVILLPFALPPIALFALGVSWFLSSLAVYVRDVNQITAVALQALFFATPIFYPVEAVPDGFRLVLLLNPLTGMVDILRAVVLGTGCPTLGSWATAYGIGVISCMMGHAWFTITRRGFADVL